VYIYRIVLLTLGTLNCLRVCMVAQLHALRAQQNKHLLGVEISERKHWSCLLRIERSQLRWFGVCPGCPKKYWQGKFCWLHPRESGPEAVQALGGVTSGVASPNTWGAKNLGGQNVW